jgi:hypothetical protein
MPPERQLGRNFAGFRALFELCRCRIHVQDNITMGFWGLAPVGGGRG